MDEPIWNWPNEFGEVHTRAGIRGRQLCRQLPPGAKLRYIGPDDKTFADFHPIKYGEIVTIVGRIPAKIALMCRQADGYVTGLNLYSLAYVTYRYY